MWQESGVGPGYRVRRLGVRFSALGGRTPKTDPGDRIPANPHIGFASMVGVTHRRLFQSVGYTGFPLGRVQHAMADGAFSRAHAGTHGCLYLSGAASV